ncbi:Galactoside-binding lectin family protein [Brugia malayi]|uniref:Galectin n=1 Tax=Brugia malayi TaxID=6279 RepID=A0A158PYK5_BRUMA|nr:Galactoside-binding lectin family protein [Brugia malayi]CDQ03430.1 Bm2767, isoform c [Brugia malayi]VIO88441.1 Galactoside-binding lectin family protein [Brugia malayi]
MAHPGDAAIPVPYISKLGAKLQPGQTLVIHGSIENDASEFEVNLLNGSPNIESSKATIFHIKVYFKENRLVYNTYENGKWGKEEKSSNPFKKGDNFDLRIRIHEDKLEIFGNQKELHIYKARINVSSVEYLTIRGNISLKGVHWGGRYYTLPFETQFPGGHLKADERIYVYGIPKGERFEIDFVSRNGDILFHFNPRFKEKQLLEVIRNAQIGDIWGQEEREGIFPFKKDIGTDIILHNAPYSIQIFIDGKRYGTFAHRTIKPDEDYMALRIAGDFELTGMEFTI